MQHRRRPVRSVVVPRAIAALAAGAVFLAACGADDDSDDEATESASQGPADEDSANHAAATQSVPALATETGEEATVLAIVGDAGELNDDTLEVAALVRGADPDAVFTVGDNEYVTEGRTVEAFVESVGGVYGDWIDAGTFFPIPGDHDYGDRCDDDAPADLDAYLEYFELPVGPEDETYYEVRVGDVHVFALDSLEACHRDGGAKLERQRRWLADQAAASDAALTIVLLHTPPYSSGVSHGSVESLRWDFDDWGVDLVVSGDDHIYERSTHDGVAYVVNGLGGIEAHELGDPIDGSEVLYAGAFGALFVSLDATAPDAATAASARPATVSFVTVDGDVVDRFELDVSSARSSSNENASPSNENPSPSAPSPLAVDSSWHWQLQGDVDVSTETGYDVDVYDIDLFDTPPSSVDALHAAGRTVICYFSAGSYESWRRDSDGFTEDDLGEPLDGFADERWLDVRSPTVRSVAVGRLDRAVAAGCDGVEPDNVDGYVNDTGFDLTGADQLDFNRFLADEAHRRGLLIGLKNDVDQLAELVDHFDFALNEQCHEYDECDGYAAFVEQGKPVFVAEYADRFVADPDLVCIPARRADLRALILPLDLDDSFRIECDA